jgi:hypothetical protein
MERVDLKGAVQCSIVPNNPAPNICTHMDHMSVVMNAGMTLNVFVISSFTLYPQFAYILIHLIQIHII